MELYKIIATEAVDNIVSSLYSDIKSGKELITKDISTTDNKWSDLTSIQKQKFDQIRVLLKRYNHNDINNEIMKEAKLNVEDLLSYCKYESLQIKKYEINKKNRLLHEKKLKQEEKKIQALANKQHEISSYNDNMINFISNYHHHKIPYQYIRKQKKLQDKKS